MLWCANEISRFRLPGRQFKVWFKATLRALGAPANSTAQLIFISARRSRELYKHYGGINKATTILAFPWQERPVPGFKPGRYLGEIYLAPSVVKSQFGGGRAYEAALRVLLVHATLHLLGFNHQAPARARRFRQREAKILKRLH